MKRRIVNLSNDTTGNYRVGVDICLHCDARLSYQQWERVAHTLILQPRIVKNGHVAVMAECPKCFENSWHHYRMSEFTWGHEAWPKSWRDAVAEVRITQTTAAQVEWQNSLCSNCTKLEKGDIDTHAWRNCEIGSGPVKRQCDAFVEITMEAKIA